MTIDEKALEAAAFALAKTLNKEQRTKRCQRGTNQASNARRPHRKETMTTVRFRKLSGPMQVTEVLVDGTRVGLIRKKGVWGYILDLPGHNIGDTVAPSKRGLRSMAAAKKRAREILN